MKISVDTDRVADLQKNGDKILFSPEGEQTLIELYKLAATVEDAIHSAKKQLAESALKLDPNFTSIQGDNVKVAFRAYGARFRIDETRLQEIPKEFYKTKTSYSPEPKAIESFIDEHSAPPIGIIENTREKQIQVRIKGVKNAEE